MSPLDLIGAGLGKLFVKGGALFFGKGGVKLVTKGAAKSADDVVGAVTNYKPVYPNAKQTMADLDNSAGRLNKLFQEQVKSHPTLRNQISNFTKPIQQRNLAHDVIGSETNFNKVATGAHKLFDDVDMSNIMHRNLSRRPTPYEKGSIAKPDTMKAKLKKRYNGGSLADPSLLPQNTGLRFQNQVLNTGIDLVGTKGTLGVSGNFNPADKFQNTLGAKATWKPKIGTFGVGANMTNTAEGRAIDANVNYAKNIGANGKLAVNANFVNTPGGKDVGAGVSYEQKLGKSGPTLKIKGGYVGGKASGSVNGIPKYGSGSKTAVGDRSALKYAPGATEQTLYRPEFQAVTVNKPPMTTAEFNKYMADTGRSIHHTTRVKDAVIPPAITPPVEQKQVIQQKVTPAATVETPPVQTPPTYESQMQTPGFQGNSDHLGQMGRYNQTDLNQTQGMPGYGEGSVGRRTVRLAKKGQRAEGKAARMDDRAQATQNFGDRRAEDYKNKSKEALIEGSETGDRYSRLKKKTTNKVENAKAMAKEYRKEADYYADKSLQSSATLRGLNRSLRQGTEEPVSGQLDATKVGVQDATRDRKGRLLRGKNQEAPAPEEQPASVQTGNPTKRTVTLDTVDKSTKTSKTLTDTQGKFTLDYADGNNPMKLTQNGVTYTVPENTGYTRKSEFQLGDVPGLKKVRFARLKVKSGKWAPLELTPDGLPKTDETPEKDAVATQVDPAGTTGYVDPNSLGTEEKTQAPPQDKKADPTTGVKTTSNVPEETAVVPETELPFEKLDYQSWIKAYPNLDPLQAMEFAAEERSLGDQYKTMYPGGRGEHYSQRSAQSIALWPDDKLDNKDRGVGGYFKDIWNMGKSDGSGIEYQGPMDRSNRWNQPWPFNKSYGSAIDKTTYTPPEAYDALNPNFSTEFVSSYNKMLTDPEFQRTMRDHWFQNESKKWFPRALDLPAPEGELPGK
jgi:hypothetical protein